MWSRTGSGGYPTPDDYPPSEKAPSKYGHSSGAGMHCSKGADINLLGFEFNFLIVPYSTAVVRVVWEPPPNSWEESASSINIDVIGQIFHKNGDRSNVLSLTKDNVSMPITPEIATQFVVEWFNLPEVANCFVETIDVIKDRASYSWCYYAQLAPLNKDLHLLAKRKYRDLSETVRKGCSVDIRCRPTMEMECSLSEAPYKVWYVYDRFTTVDSFMKALHRFFGSKKRDKYLLRQFQTGFRSFWRRFIPKYFRLEDE